MAIIMDMTAGNSRENVHGSDDRVLVSSTTTFPYSAVVKVEMDFDGDGYYEYVGSGAMISANDVLTCGHNLWSETYGFVKNVKVIPGLAGTSEPYGSATGVQWHVPNEYVTSKGSFSYDIGVINLGSDIGKSTGWFGLQPVTAAQVTNQVVRMAGYPGDLRNGLYQYTSSDDVDFVSSNQLNYDGKMDSGGGNSGGPVWWDVNGTPTIVGVHTFGGYTYNGGTILNTDFYNRVLDWAGIGTGTDTTQIDGTDGNDVLNGGNAAETLRGFQGNDTISGGGGSDVLYGHQGLDLLNGNDGNDTVFAGKGADTVYGAAGNDAIYGNNDNDILYGEAGTDIIFGGKNADTIYGGDGNDTLYGDMGDDLLYGDNAVSSSGAGTDVIYGGSGNDTVVYLNARANYAIERLSDGGIRIGSADTVYDVETFRFSDQTVAVWQL